MAEKIIAGMIIEMIGRPPEHIDAVLKSIISDKIEKEQGIKIISKKIYEPKIIKDSKADFYSNFAEIDFEADKLTDLARIIFAYMPSHVEIIKPEEFKLKSFDFGNVLNEIIRRIHQYDEIFKRSEAEKIILTNQLAEIKSKTINQPENNLPKNPPEEIIVKKSVRSKKNKKSRKKN
jgi:hypothetical protein